MVNTPMHALEKLVAKWLSPITKVVPTYIRDLNHPIKRMNDLGPMQSNEFLFTANAVIMYPNIDTEEDIAAILLSFELNII